MSLAAPVSDRPEAFPLPLLMIALGGGITGFAPLLVRISELGPLATAGWRMALASLAILPFLSRGGGSSRRGGLLLIGLAGVFFACDLGLFHSSLSFTSIAQATLIVNLAPMVALGAGFLLFGEKLGAAKLGGLVLAIGGAGLMTMQKAGVPGALSGNLMAFLAMLGYAAYLITVKRVRLRHDPATVLVGSSIVSAVVLLAAAAVAGETLLPGSIEGMVILIALGAGAHALGQGFVAIGIGRAPVGLASILLLTQPVVAAIAAWGILGETLAPVEFAGALLILSGMALASRAKG